MRIRDAETADDLRRCHPVMAELRPHVGPAELAGRVRRQMETDGYRLALLEDGGEVRAVAGFRFGECLAWGRFLYVDDLVTADAHRSKGYGKALLDWLAERAREKGCEQLHLDSGVQRFAAHRFYLRQRMDITSHHFAMRLGE
jgi:GNAT superfamily N-acetyltransferase